MTNSFNATTLVAYNHLVKIFDYMINLKQLRIVYKMNLKAIIQSGLIKTNTIIRPLMPNSTIEATINSNGELVFDSHHFENLDQAMLQVLTPEVYQQSTSTGWQFWGVQDSKRKTWIPLEHCRAKLSMDLKPTPIRTSETHPLRIDIIELPNKSGKIGMTFCPGKKIMGLYGGQWQRDINLDLNVIEKANTSSLLSVIEDHEFDILGVPNFKTTVKNYKFQWQHLLIKDCETPSAIFKKQWKILAPNIHQQLSNNELIVIHCRGGLGRTGLLAARILVETGFTPVDAISLVRSTRAHTIETFAQEYYILTQAWKK